jgi:hypothetical protein
MRKRQYERDRYVERRFEYHGNTAVERIQKKAGKFVRRDWLYFDSVEEAEDYFVNVCETDGIRASAP